MLVARHLQYFHPFDVSVVCRFPVFLLRGYPLCPAGDFIDFHVELNSPSLLRAWIRPQVNFVFDGVKPFNFFAA